MNDNNIRILPINQIRVINPRTRNQKVFADLVENIAEVGLKRPITVTGSTDENGMPCYNLLCGQGRLEACQLLGEDVIPCRIVKADSEESYLISLVENIARRKHTNMELFAGIKILSERGYKSADIARKTGFATNYIGGILHLLNAGEERLINGVEKGFLPMSIAVAISRAEDKDIQRQLTELYQEEKLKSSDIAKIRNIVNRRNLIGKRVNPATDNLKSAIYHPKTIFNIYKEETKRQQAMVKQAEFDEQQLHIIISCLNKLFDDKYFQLVLRTENITDMPKDLSKRLKQYREGNHYA